MAVAVDPRSRSPDSHQQEHACVPMLDDCPDKVEVQTGNPDRAVAGELVVGERGEN